MENSFQQHNTIVGTIGGTTLVLLVKTSVSEIIHTILLAGIGAVVSFSVSVLLKMLFKYCRRKYNHN